MSIRQTRRQGTFASIALAVSLASLALLPLGARGAVAGAAAMQSASQVMNWFPEPEHGGFYAADMMKLYQKHGLNLTIKPFSFAYQGLDIVKEVALGRITFGMANADDVFAARQQGLPVVAVMTSMQHDLQCFMWHANDKSIKTLADLSNHTIIYGFGSTFWDYLMSKYHYTNIKTINYDFTLRSFLAIPNAVNQGYITEEPYTAIHSGHPVEAALIASAGYDPYYQVMVTSESEIKNHPDVVRAYVAASVEGWKAYFSSMKNQEAVNLYMRNNPTAKSFPLTPDTMDYAAKVAKGLVMGGDAAMHGIGYMDPARMVLLKKQLLGVGLEYNGVDPMSTFTDQFLPKM